MTSLPSIPGRSVRAAAALACAALLLAAPGGRSQTPEGEATPVAGAEADGPHPAHIHAGTCDELGGVVVPLADVADPDVAGERVGPATAHPTKISSTAVDLPLEEIIAGGHAINVHLGAGEMGEYIACGDVGGVVVTDHDDRGELNIGLRELNGSGHVGTAWLGADGDRTNVEVILVEPDEMR